MLENITALAGSALAELSISSERWFSCATSDVLARPTIITTSSWAIPASEIELYLPGSNTLTNLRTRSPISEVLIKSVKAVADLLNLPPGWDSYSAKQIDRKIAAKATELLTWLIKPTTAAAPAVVPRVQGGIQLEWHSRNINSSQDIKWFAEDLESGMSFEGPLAGNESVLNEWIQRTR